MNSKYSRPQSISTAAARTQVCISAVLLFCAAAAWAADPNPDKAQTSSTVAALSLKEAGAGSNAPAVLDDRYKLTLGDRVSFRIAEDEEEPKELSVTDSGDLEVPYIGRVPAAGQTCRQLAGEIKAKLEKDYYYQATVVLAVDLMSKTHGRVYLVGAVKLPGPVELPGDEVLTLSKAVLRAGGFTDYADKRHVRLTRNDAKGKRGGKGGESKRMFTVNVGDIYDKGKIESDLPLEPGDLIFVPDRLIRF
jgi:protein involved in polysaccharide export with SLBB domain